MSIIQSYLGLLFGEKIPMDHTKENKFKEKGVI